MLLVRFLEMVSHSAQDALVSDQQSSLRAAIFHLSETSHDPSGKDLPRFAVWDLDDVALSPLIQKPRKPRFDLT